MGIVKDLISTFIGDKLIETIKSATDSITDNVCQIANNRIVEYLCSEYERNYKTKTILHRSEPVELDKFYQPLFLHKEFDRWIRRFSLDAHDRISTEDITALLESNNCITIIGTAGSGKSTLVKYLFVDTIRKDYKIPLKVELRYLNNFDGNLLSYITDELIKFSGIAESNRIIQKLLESGKFVIFFDGYDEVSSIKKEEVTHDICKITKKYTANKYILTSRPFVNIDMLENFHNYEVCDLTIDEIYSFVKKQFSDSEQELADKIIETINDENSQTYKSFLSNPLLLSMFIITYQTDSNIPQKRSDYYNQVFNTLYSAHDTSSKLGFTREKKSGLSKENFIDILKRFSFKSFFNQKYTFPTTYFEEELKGIKKDLNLSFDNDNLIFDLEVAIGILTQEGLDITYPHRSLQEYFAALFVTTLSYENKLKVYEFLYNLFKKVLNQGQIQNDNVNFYSLLSEMDTIVFQKKLVIPLLNDITHIVKTLHKMTDIIDFFISVRSIAHLFNKEMKMTFDQEHDKYNLKFSEYLSDCKKDRKDVTDEEFQNCREKLATNDILPFIINYKYDDVIASIQDSIKSSETIDSNFISSLI